MNPLDRLTLLIASPPIGWWPPAPGWWSLAALPPLLGWELWRLRRYLPWRTIATRGETPLDSLREAAPAELAALAKPYGRVFAGSWLQVINDLLKRVRRVCWSDSGSHALSGCAWLAFPDNHCPAAGLTRWMILVEGGYRTGCTLGDKVADGLDAAVAAWIRKHV